jgi:hypothetical protein
MLMDARRIPVSSCTEGRARVLVALAALTSSASLPTGYPRTRVDRSNL